jgi:hypothetical protein
MLATMMDVINQTVGDAISDMLIVETVLHARGWSIQDWEATYTDLPNRQLKVVVKVGIKSCFFYSAYFNGETSQNGCVGCMGTWFCPRKLPVMSNIVASITYDHLQ